MIEIEQLHEQGVYLAPQPSLDAENEEDVEEAA